MKYETTVMGRFLDRPNRFIAHVDVNGEVQTVHVKNTGRCKELLLPGVEVCLEAASNPNRKTAYDLISVRKEGLGWVNIDSQVCNLCMKEWLSTQGYDLIHPEFTYGSSRIDFLLKKGQESYLVEIKGCTLEIDGLGYFPDAPSTRAHKHLKELTGALQAGFHPVVAFVIAMPKVKEVLPNEKTDPEFARLLEIARQAGVEIWYLLCDVTPDSIVIREKMIAEK